MLGFPVAQRAVRTGNLETGTESAASGTVAEAAFPVVYQGRVVRVIVYSDPVSDAVRNVATVRHEILVAGGIALLLALIGGYLVARLLTRRVKRLEQAAERVAAGEFERPIPVDSTDELGQLAVAFNQMQRQLAQLDLARKKFIATASHELRTPIFSLGGFVELLEDEDLDPDTRSRFLEQVREQVERLRKLSVDLLDLSKLEAGSLELRPEEVDLGELTRSVSGEFEPTLAQHDSHLELRLARRIEAMCDPVRVAQIIRILIDNALTHTPPGTQITVTAGREDGHVRMAVRDDGTGIEPQAMQRIFEPFYTADDAQGSGLGLAIASELAERMDGSLSVSSTARETVFTLEIPPRPSWLIRPSRRPSSRRRRRPRRSMTLSAGWPGHTPILSLSGYTATAGVRALENISTRAAVSGPAVTRWAPSGPEAKRTMSPVASSCVPSGVRTDARPASTISHSSSYS